MSEISKELDAATKEFEREVQAELETLGRKAVSVAKATGTYQDITGRLRKGNRFRVEGDTLMVENIMPYASFVEARGKVVLGGAEEFIRQEISKYQ